MVIVAVFRHVHGDTEKFVEELMIVLDDIISKNKGNGAIFLIGDMNIDLIRKCRKNDSYINNLEAFGFRQVIDKLT